MIHCGHPRPAPVCKARLDARRGPARRRPVAAAAWPESGYSLAVPVAPVDGRLAPAPGPESADGWALSSLGGNVGNELRYRLPVP